MAAQELPGNDTAGQSQSEMQASSSGKAASLTDIRHHILKVISFFKAKFKVQLSVSQKSHKLIITIKDTEDKTVMEAFWRQ